MVHAFAIIRYLIKIVMKKRHVAMTTVAKNLESKTRFICKREIYLTDFIVWTIFLSFNKQSSFLEFYLRDWGGGKVDKRKLGLK